MPNPDEKELVSQTSDNAETGAADNALSYHAPTLTSFGPLAELVKTNPAVGSDGGTGDCQHF